ncbi:MAG: hypothetical protein EZS28_051940 [Streblomastix strix]|uniref:Uncharacterized protein n=1 Tax=Streblomastix strix TaxID=222440 RepID=A0A5J4SVS7_9EUKA|nr:MAG: hypothetical protein EZS28_051940 [Streblomastix strix]
MKKTKFTGQKNQQQSESSTSLSSVNNSLQFIAKHLQSNEFKKLIKNPNFLHSLSALSLYKIGYHSKEKVERLRLNIRHWSRYCLFYIQYYGDEQDQTELVNVGIGRMTSIAFCTAGGVGDEQDVEIKYELNQIFWLLGQLNEGRHWQPSFQPLPLLARRTEEQIEEEGANEELDAQIKNNGYYLCIKYWAIRTKAVTLNHFVNWY